MHNIKRKRAGDNFTILSNDFLRDENLSLKAKGLLAYILSLPDDWKIYFEEVEKHHSDGVRAVRSAWKELEANGYARTKKLRNGNRIKEWSKEVADYKFLDCGFVDVQNVHVQSEDVQNSMLLNTNKPITNESNTNLTNNNISDKSDKKSDLEIRFNNIWKIYPNKKGKPNALLAYKRAIKSGTTDEEIKNGLENYLKEIKIKNTQKNYIKHGSTWFNGKGWEDDYDLIPIQEFKNSKVIKSAPNWSNQRFEKDEETMTTEEFEEYMNGLDS